jgi:hypothetical protein
MHSRITFLSGGRKNMHGEDEWHVCLKAAWNAATKVRRQSTPRYGRGYIRTEMDRSRLERDVPLTDKSLNPG